MRVLTSHGQGRALSTASKFWPEYCIRKNFPSLRLTTLTFSASAPCCDQKRLGSWSRYVRLVLMRKIFCSIAVLVCLGSAYAEPQIDSRTAKIDNVELHYLTAGHGPAVILLHGFAETARMW